jgi:hypothetical protein
MAGLCSAHRDKVPGCAACEATIYDLLPNYDRLIAEAEVAGRHTCECGFVYFKTTYMCPKCYRCRS